MRLAQIAIVALLAGASIAVVAAPPPAQSMAELIKAARSDIGSGYLKPELLPSSLLMLAQPPAAGSAALARDEEAAKAALAMRGSPRWAQAAADAEIISPTSTGAMSCAAGFAIGDKETPAIQKLLRRSTADFGLVGNTAKRKYVRARPFMVNGEPSCTPDWEPLLRQDGSFPSGHSAVGFGWGLILAEIVPDRAAELIARGRAYGDSRRVCNVHWLSDVEEGRVAAAAVYARLHAEPEFQNDLAAARSEVAEIRAKAPTPDCAREVAALATQP
jgi:acid phosphatase (class A)